MPVLLNGSIGFPKAGLSRVTVLLSDGGYEDWHWSVSGLTLSEVTG